MPLTERVALVTGGTGALGSVVAKRLVSEGCRVFVTSRKSGLDQKSRSGLPDSVTILPADVTREDDVVRVYRDILTAASRIDIAVNCAGGYLPAKALKEVTLDDWESMMHINLTSAFLSTREALRHMSGRSFGRIINISAMAALHPVVGRAPYAISKAGVSLLTEIAAREAKGTGITVNAIAPSIIATAGNLASASGDESSKWVTPEQLADIICSLCSDASGAVTGTTIRASGGM